MLNNQKNVSKKIIDLLIANKINYHSILTGTPYSTSENWDSILDENLFYDHLFNELSFYQKMAYILNNMTIGGETYAPVIFLYGFKGTGKTTFIHWFFTKYYQKIKEEIFIEYIDYDLEEEEKSEEEEIKNSGEIRKPLAQQFIYKIMLEYNNMRIEFTEYIKWLKPILRELRQVFSSTFIRALENIDIANSEIDQHDYYYELEDIINNAKFSEIIIFYLVYKMKFNSQKKHFIFVFDNLDSLKLEYINAKLAKDISIIDTKLKLLLQNNKISTNRILPKYNLVFLLRDANCALVNMHVKNKEELKSKTVGFNISVGEENLFERRLDFAEVLIKRNVFKSKTHKILVELKNDIYSTKVFSQLFNFDHREYIGFLVKISENSINSNMNNIPILQEYSRILKPSEKKLEDYGKFGARGIIYYYLIDYLLTDEFLKNFEKLNYRKGSNGYFNPIRLILTLITNMNNFEISKERLIDNDYKINYKFDSTSIANVVEQLLPLYSLETILSVIENYFLCFKKSWSHLVTIHGFNLTKKNQLLDSLKERLSLYLNDDSNSDKKFFNNIRLKVNPSGYIYLTYIIIHFEFFSRRVNNSRPLFLATNYDSKKKKFQFEIFIDNVYRKVKDCILEMNKFYEEKFVKKLGYDDQEFLKSDFSFKFKKNDIIESEEKYEAKYYNTGHFYSHRLIENHISYIDSFRIYILNNDEHFEKLNPYNYGYTKYKLNEILVEKVRNYVELYNHLHSNERNKRMYNVFMSCINEIKDSSYKNMKLSISVNRSEF